MSGSRVSTFGTITHRSRSHDFIKSAVLSICSVVCTHLARHYTYLANIVVVAASKGPSFLSGGSISRQDRRERTVHSIGIKEKCIQEVHFLYDDNAGYLATIPGILRFTVLHFNNTKMNSIIDTCIYHKIMVT